VFLGTEYVLAAVARDIPSTLNDFIADSIFSSDQLQRSVFLSRLRTMTVRKEKKGTIEVKQNTI
jgi:hypothetical protein